jgi:hypothetical protein
MTRGKRPVPAMHEAKKFAEQIHYRWMENTDKPGLACDITALKEY